MLRYVRLLIDWFFFCRNVSWVQGWEGFLQQRVQEGVHRGGDRGAHDSGSCSKSLIKICLLPRQSSSSSMILPAIFFLCLQRRVYWESEGGKSRGKGRRKKGNASRSCFCWKERSSQHRLGLANRCNGGANFRDLLSFILAAVKLALRPSPSIYSLFFFKKKNATLFVPLVNHLTLYSFTFFISKTNKILICWS